MADACRPLAEVVRTVAEGGNAQAAVDATKSALDRLREVQSALGFRPIGPSGHQQALLGLVDSLGQGWRFSSVLASAGPLPETDRGLARAVASMLDAIADVLQRCAENRQGEVPDIEALVGVRHAHRQHLDDHARAALAANEPAGLVLARYTAVFPVRVLSFIALSMATDAIVMSGRTVRADDDFFIVEPTEAEGAVKHAANLLAPHLSLRSVWFHNSLRAGIALALAVLVAKMTDIGHAFWVVLATLSVLRSNVATTGSTVVSAWWARSPVSCLPRW
jgi:hypothetical protein